MAKVTKFLAFLMLLTAVSGCSILEGSRPWPDERRVVSRDWVKPQIDEKEPPIYCYRTLGTVECHKEPLPGGEQRIVNSHDAQAYDKGGDYQSQ
jgi:hypothetical protein